MATKLQARLTSAIKATHTEPWKQLPQFRPYDATKHSYPLRTGTMPPRVTRYSPILDAALLYGRSDLITTPPQFRMVTRNSGQTCETFVEVLQPDDSSLLIYATESKLRISLVEPDGTKLSAGKFQDFSEYNLSATVLALLYHILAMDQANGDKKIAEAIMELCDAVDNAMDPNNLWKTEDDFPDIAKDAVYYLDAVFCVLKDKMTIDCGPDTSDSPAEIDDSFFRSPRGFSGDLVCEYLGEDEDEEGEPTWTPRFVMSNGVAARYGRSFVSIKEAKEKYAGFMAHREWNEYEKSLIRTFDDDMPVMPETIRIADRIIRTKNDTNPVCNIMWRGVTSYGKSTGIKQLSCILNMPLLIQTCHSSTEAQDFQVQIIPATLTDGGEMAETLVFKADKEALESKHPLFADAMAHIQSLDEAARKRVLDQRQFFELAMMDTDAAAEELLGKEQEMDTAELCAQYSEICVFLSKAPLEQKIQKLEQDNQSEKPERNTPEFVTVVAPFMEAMMKGYLVEVQEASRIRDPGVLVSLNEFDRPGAVMKLMNGTLARRHKDAIFLISDNVGYASCRDLDPSVIRRFGMIIDSNELSEEDIKARVKWNTGITDDDGLIDQCYTLWNTVKEFCERATRSLVKS